MPARPPSGAQPVKFPFHVTQSELRILHELVAIAALRGLDVTAWQDERKLAERNIATAAGCIESLKETLFPEETKLRKARSEFLKPLNSSNFRAHFDQSLETAALTLHAQIQNKADYEKLLTHLQAFSFDEWQTLCSNERIDAD